MKKTLYLLYAVVCYLFFFITFLYLMGFVGNLVVPKALDTNTTTVLFASVVLLFLFLIWQPLPTVLWSATLSTSAFSSPSGLPP